MRSRRLTTRTTPPIRRVCSPRRCACASSTIWPACGGWIRTAIRTTRWSTACGKTAARCKAWPSASARGALSGSRSIPRSEVRRKKASQSVPQLDGQRPRVDFLERELVRGGDARLDQAVEVRAELDAVALHVELEVEPQAARVPVGGAEQRPRAVDHHQLRVVERARTAPYAAAVIEHLPELAVHRPVHVRQVVALGDDDVHLDAAQRRR